MSSKYPVTSLPWAPPATTPSYTPHCTTNSCPTCVTTSCLGREGRERTEVRARASWRCPTEWHALTPPPMWPIYQVLLQTTLFFKTTTTKFFQCGMKRHSNSVTVICSVYFYILSLTGKWSETRIHLSHSTFEKTTKLTEQGCKAFINQPHSVLYK